MGQNTCKEIKEKSGLQVGMKVKIEEKPKGKKSSVIKGEIISIPNHHIFVINNGMHNETFRFGDIDCERGITVKVI